MINRLAALYELQTIDDELDALQSLRGDLPLAVQALKERIDGLVKTKDEKEDEIKKNEAKKLYNDGEVALILENQKRFKSQLHAVRNNREYDALAKEIDHAETMMKKLDTETDSLTSANKILSHELEAIIPQIDELKIHHAEKEEDLKTIVKANEREEAKYLEKRKALQAEIKQGDYSTYMRIRKAKGGKAVATIKRQACSGCHNVVPSQRQLEIRRNNKVFTCEYCGRILVSNEVAESISK